MHALTITQHTAEIELLQGDKVSNRVRKRFEIVASKPHDSHVAQRSPCDAVRCDVV
jgi:hypothetical protein